MNNHYLLLHESKEPENGVLYLVGTPIGNLSDISIRAIKILTNVSLIACEDTRQTRKLMNKYQFTNKLISFNKDNSLKKTPKLIDHLRSGKSIAIVSDAGLPSICDPGEDLAREARKSGVNVVSIPGPCAALTALTSCGFPSSKFTFEGFLPKRKSQREKILFEISKNDKTTIIYESPRRLMNLLYELKDYCGGDREINVSRELTKKFEENICNNINQVISFFESKEILGEITLVLNGKKRVNNEIKFDEVEIKKELRELINAGLSLSQASKYLAKKNNLKKSIIYNLR